MTTKEGHLSWAANRARGVANSVEANERRSRRKPPTIDWDKAIANLLDILDDPGHRRRHTRRPNRPYVTW